MKDQHEKIKGYRDLSQAEVDLMNEIKAQGEVLKTLLVKVGRHLHEQRKAAIDAKYAAATSDIDAVASAEIARLDDAEPAHWATLGATNLQTGIMFMVRSVAQPTTF